MKKLAAILVFGIISCGQHTESKKQETKSDTTSSNQILDASVTPLQTNLPSIQIGTQIWTTKNLDISTFRNGDTIPEAKTSKEWLKANHEKRPAWCYYDNDTANGVKYGKLYNWYAVIDSRGLAPVGWHIPSNSEWETLIIHLRADSTVAVDKKLKEIGTTHWKNDEGADNSSGFTALPSGGCFADRKFYGIGAMCSLWSSTETDLDNAWIFIVGVLPGYALVMSVPKQKGFPVRCLKD